MKISKIATIMLAAMAVSAGNAAAKGIDELRIYINPGHGSWTGNDRAMQVIGKPKYSSTNTDTTGFFESNTNLYKGFGVLEALINMGFKFDRTLNQEGERWEIGAAKDLSQQLVMSRVKNGPYEANNVTSSDNYMLYNRKLLEIATEVEYNDFDMFISIHSNAASSDNNTTNYHLYMYRGHNGKENVLAEGSWEMCEAGYIYSFANEHAAWSTQSHYINGDIDFMSPSHTGSTNELGYYGYLGVLKHGVPGYLVEGYFHTYQPARHRGMNFDVDFEEGCAYARGVAEYFGFEREKTGDIYGIVRDQHQKFKHALYSPRAGSDDVYKPLNGVKVTLLKDGQPFKEYTTDQFYNGAYVFTGLEPGKYAVTYEHPDYKPLAEPQEIEVVPGNCVYPKSYLENKEWVAPADLKETYPDQLDEKTAYGAADSYNFNKVYADQAIPELEGKTIRRTVVRGNNMYVLALAEDKTPTIVVYDLAAKKLLANVSTSGMQGSILNCADIQVTADGVLVASSQSKLHYSTDQSSADGEERGTVRFYRWENTVDGVPTGDPINFISTQNSSLWYRTKGGGTFAYFGTLEDGTISMANPNFTAPNHGLRTLEISVSEGAAVSESVHKPVTAANATFNAPDTGDDYLFVASPLNGRDVWVMTSKAGMFEYSNNTPDSNTPAQAIGGSALPVDMTGASAMRYSGHSYIVLPPAADGGQMQMFDVTDGIAAPKAVTVKDAEQAAAAGRSAAWVNVTRDKDDNSISDVAIELTALAGDKVSRFSTAGVAQPAVRAAYAYDLNMTKEEDGYTLTFKSTGDAAKAQIVLTPVDGKAEKKVIEAGAIATGDNTVKVAMTDLPENVQFTWAVKVINDDVPYAGIIVSAQKNLKNNTRGGVAWINDPESANYGRLVVSNGYAQGVDVYSPTLELVGRYLPEGHNWQSGKVNSPLRIGQNNGIAYLCDWSDPGAGYWYFDASKPETTYDALGGTREKSSGAHMLDGKSIGGGSTGVAFQGSGDETRMYSFVEDYPTGNGTMNLVRYKVGNETSWTQAPEKSFDNVTAKSLMTGTNVEIVTTPDGVFVSQARNSNAESSPAFIYMDNDGKVLFNSGAELSDDLPTCGSGIALNADMSVMAISEANKGIGIWDVTWADNVPTLKKRYLIPGSAGCAEVNQLSFDAAGNLYAYHRSNFGMRAYSVRAKAPVAVTAAPKTMTLSASSGVSDITVEGAEGPVRYYNLQGVEVCADRLTPGVYIRVQGRTSTKVVVR